MHLDSFTKEKFGDTFLDEIAEWLSEYCEIDEIFNKKIIESWLEDHAEDYGYVKEGE